MVQDFNSPAALCLRSSRRATCLRSSRRSTCVRSSWHFDCGEMPRQKVDPDVFSYDAAFSWARAAPPTTAAPTAAARAAAPTSTAQAAAAPSRATPAMAAPTTAAPPTAAPTTAAPPAAALTTAARAQPRQQRPRRQWRPPRPAPAWSASSASSQPPWTWQQRLPLRCFVLVITAMLTLTNAGTKLSNNSRSFADTILKTQCARHDESWIRWAPMRCSSQRDPRRSSPAKRVVETLGPEAVANPSDASLEEFACHNELWERWAQKLWLIPA